MGLASCGSMGSLLWNSLWRIAVDPHRGGSISLRPKIDQCKGAFNCYGTRSGNQHGKLQGESPDLEHYPVLNGGDEETGLSRPRLVATQLECEKTLLLRRSLLQSSGGRGSARSGRILRQAHHVGDEAVRAGHACRQLAIESIGVVHPHAFAV